MNAHTHPRLDDAANRRRLRWALSILLAAALFLLWQGHRAHLLVVLPWLLLLACPLLHQAMHRGHNVPHDVPRDGSAGSPREPGRTHGQHEYGGGC